MTKLSMLEYEGTIDFQVKYWCPSYSRSKSKRLGTSQKMRSLLIIQVISNPRPKAIHCQTTQLKIHILQQSQWWVLKQPCHKKKPYTQLILITCYYMCACSLSAGGGGGCSGDVRQIYIEKKIVNYTYLPQGHIWTFLLF